MLGIDVSKARLTCTLMHPTTRKREWTDHFENTEAGIRRLLERTPADVAWVVEPTGRYSNLVVQVATAAGRRVLLAQTRRAKYFLASLRPGVKTDCVDSEGLAQFGLSQPLPPYPQRSETVEQIQQLQAARKGLTLSISRLQQQADELPYAREHLEGSLNELKAQRAALDAKIDELLRQHEEFAMYDKLLTVPGIGPVTAAAVLTCLTTKQFEHPDQFVSYVGLAITRNQSGKSQGSGHLRKQGHAELRRLLYLAARANLTCKESPFKEQYQRERSKGLPPTAALCSVARKLARLCWSMCKHQTQYDPKRVYTQSQDPGKQPNSEKSA